MGVIVIGDSSYFCSVRKGRIMRSLKLKLKSLRRSCVILDCSLILDYWTDFGYRPLALGYR